MDGLLPLSSSLWYGWEANPMSHWDRRFINDMFHLLDECGMPERTPSSNLLHELYDMIEEHLRVTRGD